MTAVFRFRPTRARRFCALFAVASVLAGCAIQTPPVVPVEAPQSESTQRKAQVELVAAPPAKLSLKRKIALGRITNETSYGRSLLRDNAGDVLGKQVTDLLSKALTESGSYLIFERPDLNRIQDEGRLMGTKLNLVGVDALVIGSLTEFGRRTEGQTGFLSASKKQIAFAKVDLRLVDVHTGQVFFATSGAGEASTESASTLGFGSQAAYDGTLNDSAMRQAISEAVHKLSAQLDARPWQTSFLSADNGRYFISGGKSQGILPGMILPVFTAGEKIRSPQTGFDITLPGREIAKVRIDTNFGETETTEGSIASIASGSLPNEKIEQLVIRAGDFK